MMERDSGRTPAWHAFDGGASLGQAGTEAGMIIRDDEHPWGARITLERAAAPAPFAVTCGIYGWMVHTRFFGTADEAEREYAAMRRELAAILEIIPLSDDPAVDEKMDRAVEAIGGFVDRFP
jgi:hypothetical protein